MAPDLYRHAAGSATHQLNRIAGPKGYATKKSGSGVAITSSRTGKTYHSHSVGAAKKLARQHEVFEHMK
jgi:hypothetical protein